MEQNTMSEPCYHSLLCIGTTLLALLAAGCGDSASKQPTEKAVKAVEQFLDAWTRGEPPDKLADTNQPTHGSDPDWKAGYRLKSFLCAGSQQSQEMPDHVRCQVALSLQDPKGKRWNKEVVYDVQLGEKSVIRRVSP